jgi:uncharacterized protein YndB with AHSA1/START domain
MIRYRFEYLTNGAGLGGHRSRQILTVGVRCVRRRSSSGQTRPTRRQPHGDASGATEYRKDTAMPDILHRITIDAPRKNVHDLIASTDGISQWWTGRPVEGDSAVGSRFAVYFGDADRPAAVMLVRDDTTDEVAWRVVEGPESWLDTTITFRLQASGDERTTLLFEHAGWTEASEFMSGCSTNWGAYLTSLKTGAEGDGFRPYPQSEISRWS